MNINDLVHNARRKGRFYSSTYFATNVIEAVMEEIIESLERGEEVTIKNFGTFKVKHRASRTGRNPRENTPVIIPERNMPTFIPAKNFKERIIKAEN